VLRKILLFLNGRELEKDPSGKQQLKYIPQIKGSFSYSSLKDLASFCMTSWENRPG